MCATISAIDHLSGAGRLRATAGLTPLNNFASRAGAAASNFKGFCPSTYPYILFRYCSAVSCIAILLSVNLNLRNCKPPPVADRSRPNGSAARCEDKLSRVFGRHRPQGQVKFWKPRLPRTRPILPRVVQFTCIDGPRRHLGSILPGGAKRETLRGEARELEDGGHASGDAGGPGARAQA